MYNPQNLYECEKQKERVSRKFVDGLMTVIGGLASISSIPQVIKIWQTGNVGGVSLATQLFALIAVLAWLIYGLYIKNKPLAITSSASSVILGIVVVQILMYT